MVLRGRALLRPVATAAGRAQVRTPAPVAPVNLPLRPPEEPRAATRSRPPALLAAQSSKDTCIFLPGRSLRQRCERRTSSPIAACMGVRWYLGRCVSGFRIMRASLGAPTPPIAILCMHCVLSRRWTDTTEELRDIVFHSRPAIADVLCLQVCADAVAICIGCLCVLRAQAMLGLPCARPAYEAAHSARQASSGHKIKNI